MGGTTGEDEPALAGAFLVGSPLVLGEDLYVLAEIRGDLSLFVLDAQTGRLQWSQQLAHVGQFNIQLDVPRRLAAATPSYSDGILVCPTSDCSLQRRHQKLVETAPAPALDGGTRARILESAVRLAKAAGYRNIGTFEFLVAADGSLGATSFAFMEANPRLQVEHTVTEELLGIDLVALQLRLADGASLAELGYSAPPPLPSGYAIQARVNAEIMTADGHVVASAGVITTLDLPSGPGIRVDTSAHCAYRADPRFDSLLAKVIVRSRSAAFEHAVAKLTGALGELHVDGIATNAGVLRALLRLDDVAQGRATTTFVDEHLAELVDATGTQPAGTLGDELGEDGLVAVRSPMTGVVVGVEVTAGSEVCAATDVLVLESMKMEHLVSAGTAKLPQPARLGQ